jgi:ubiquinone/menaquinone biosynthesis C-methylase UbiE
MTKIFIRDLGVKSNLNALLDTVGNVAGLRIIDIGCGEGHMTRALAALGADVIGYDPFIEEVELITDGLGNFRLLKATADAIPEPDQSADLVLFIFSLHHVPLAKLQGALTEARRILRPSGRLYVAEPLAEGRHQYVMELFHDETAVRKAAAEALEHFARPHFAVTDVSIYEDARRYASFDDFAERMTANMRFNDYSKEAVLAPKVRCRFEESFAAGGDEFNQPIRIDCFGSAHVDA